MSLILYVTDELLDDIDDVVETAMADHESVRNDSACSCGVRNNMDGDVLFTHRVGVVLAAIRTVLVSDQNGTL